MRKLHNKYLNEDFYKKEVDEDISLEEVKKIVSAPFAFTKEQMESGELPTIRLQYLCTFMVHTKRVKTILNRTEDQYERGTINKKTYDKRKEILEGILEKRGKL